MRRQARPPHPPAATSARNEILSRWRRLGHGLWDWLFSEELIEDPSSFYDSYNLHGYYFGPDMSHYPEDSLDPSDPHVSSNDAEDEDSDGDDLSLNSLSNKSSPVKFLKKPLFDLSRDGTTARFHTPLFSDSRLGLGEDEDSLVSPLSVPHPCPNCVKGTCRVKRHYRHLPVPANNSSTSSSCYSGSPIYRYKVKTSTPDLAPDSLDADSTAVQRAVAFNRLTFRNHGPGRDLRMRGDGAEDETSLASAGLGLSRDCSLSSLAEVSGAASLSSSMVDLVRGARQVRRLIREVSLDSQDSDLDLDLELRETARVDLGQFNEDMSRLIDNCDAGAGDEAEDVNGDGGANDPGDVCSSSNNVTSGTEAGDRSLARDSSVPDFSLIQRQTCVNRRLWKLTGFSEHESLNFSETSDHDNASLVSRDTEYISWNRVECCHVAGVGLPCAPAVGQPGQQQPGAALRAAGLHGVGQRVRGQRRRRRGGRGRGRGVLAAGAGPGSAAAVQQVPLAAIIHRVRHSHQRWIVEWI